MSLQDSTKKMSKSDENSNSFVAILERPDDIIKKFKKAVTDSDSCVRYDEKKPEISNLMTIYSCTTGKAFKEIEREFEGVGYGVFKEAVGECVSKHLAPIQTKFYELIKDKSYLEKCFKEHDEKALNLSNQTLNRVKEKIGLVF